MKKNTEKNDKLNDFFFNTSKKDQVKLLEKVAKEANKEQLAVIKEYKKSLKTAH